MSLTRQITVREAVEYFGTRYKLARALGLSPTTVYTSWREVVPQKHWERLRHISGGTLGGSTNGDGIE